MTDVAVIVLIGRERLHIARCVERLGPLNPRQLFIVASQPDDGGEGLARDAARALGWSVDAQDPSRPSLEIRFHAWPGNQSVQFNWALDNLPLAAKWILRLDADEYLLPETVAELKETIASTDAAALSFPLSRRIFGGWIRHGMPRIELVRAFRRGLGRSTGAEMDERIEVSSGRTLRMKGGFADDSLLPFADWKAKHRDYARREAEMALAGRANGNKRLYYRLPPYLRAVAYFCYRYFLRLGFLDGLPGWRWHFRQGLWYRLLVDREIGRRRRGAKAAD